MMARAARTRIAHTIPLAALLLAAPAVAQDEYAPFGRDPSDPASSFAARDKAGNEQHRLVRPAPAPGRIEGERCMPKTRICISINERDAQGRPLLRVREFAGDSRNDRMLPLNLDTEGKSDLSDTIEPSIWSLAVQRVPHTRYDDQGEPLLVGVEMTQRLSYSGGQAYNTRLFLYRIDAAGTPNVSAEEVLSVPLQAEQGINACFNAKDRRNRHDACLDETWVEASLLIDMDNSGPMPRLIYDVSTVSYPSDIPLRAPENLPQQLTSKDLVRATHPICTYRRMLAWNPATARYEFDRPAPECDVFGLDR